MACTSMCGSYYGAGGGSSFDTACNNEDKCICWNCVALEDRICYMDELPRIVIASYVLFCFRLNTSQNINFVLHFPMNGLPLDHIVVTVTAKYFKMRERIHQNKSYLYPRGQFHWECNEC